MLAERQVNEPDSRTASRANIFYAKADCDLPRSALEKLKSASNEALGLSSELIAAATAKAVGAPKVQARALPRQGTFHRLFSIAADRRELICKVAIPSAPDSRRALLREAAVIELVRREGVPAPAIVAADWSLTSWPFAFVVAERAKGASMLAVDEEDAKVEAAIVALIAELSRLHRVRLAGFGLVDCASDTSTPGIHGTHESWKRYLSTRLEEHVAICVRINAVTSGEGSEAVRWFESLGPDLARVEPAVLHGDPGSHNVFLTRGAVSALIDWEDALVGDPVYDFAFLATFHPQRRMRVLLAACEQTPGWRSARLFWLYFLRVALAKTVHRHRFGYADLPGREPGHLRIRFALDRLRNAH
jgi:aminoglycoside phosphotransferase (APT) family kinase protein